MQHEINGYLERFLLKMDKILFVQIDKDENMISRHD